MKYPHRVLNIKMQLVDEETGEVLAHKVARIHETDLPAGKVHLIVKSKEILCDALHALGLKKPDGMTWLTFAESKFEREGEAA